MMEEIADPSTTEETNERDAGATLTPDGCTFSSVKKLKVAIIGAGLAGLCAARHVFAEGSGMTGVVFEQSSNIGGTWVYSDVTGKDRFGVPIHSSLYHGLWTNLPKEVMQFPDMQFRDTGKSYLPSCEVLQYIVDYADHYDLHPHIKLNHIVKCVAPYGKNWSVSAIDLVNDQEHVSVYDAVIVCSGPNNIPVYPTIEGLARFSGKQLHSKEFRQAAPFAGKRVLVIGLGPSGLDITYKLMEHAKQVILSHNKPGFSKGFPTKVLVKPEVASLEDKTVTFVDGSAEDVDVIIYCTGYTYHFPFLTKDCSLIVDQCVSPLYKHFINIEHPTMAIIGLPKPIPHQYVLDYQVRTFLNILRGKVTLPDKETMEKELEEENIFRREEGQRKKDYHKMGKSRVKEYFLQLQELGDLEPVPEVQLSIFFDAFTRAIRDFGGFRETIYKIIDHETFDVSCPLPEAQVVPEEKKSVEACKTVTFEDQQAEVKENDSEPVKNLSNLELSENETEDSAKIEVEEEAKDFGEEAANMIMRELEKSIDELSVGSNGEDTEEIVETSNTAMGEVLKQNSMIEVEAVVETTYRHHAEQESIITINGNHIEEKHAVKDSHGDEIVNIVKNVECHKKDVD